MGRAARGSRADWFFALLLLVPPLLIFPNLGDAMLWQDEAETALLGRCTRLHGYPLAFDGRHVITDQLGKDLDRNGVWIWSPWLQFYTVAASFATLGESVWAARLPFALLGWATVLLAYAALRDVTGDRKLARFASLLLMTSVPFLLQVRQCRYYSLLTLFATLHWWGYLRITRGRSHGGWMFAAGGIGVCHSFFPHLALALPAMTAHWFASHRHTGVRARQFVVPLLVMALATVPFALYARAWSRNYDQSGYGFDSALRYAATLRAYLFEVHKYCWPFLWALPLSIDRGARWRQARMLALPMAAALILCAPASATSLWLMLCAAAVAATIDLPRLWRDCRTSGWQPFVRWQVVATVVLLPALSPFPFFRYLGGMLPLFALLTAALVRAVCSRLRAPRPVLAALVLLLMASDFFGHAPLVAAASLIEATAIVRPEPAAGHAPSNGVASAVITHIVDGRRCHWPLFDYGVELTHHYVGPVRAAIDYLALHARPGARLVTTYEHFPLMFATPLEVIQNDVAREQDLLPEWFFFHGNRSQPLGRQVSRALDEHRYEFADVPAIEFPWENVPEPYWHQFKTLRVGPRVRLAHLR